MARSIWKWPVPQADNFSLPMPVGAKVLALQVQDGEPCVWAEVDPLAPTEPRYFHLFGTGHEMPRGMGYSDVYVGTWQSGPFVWHLYEVTGI